MLAWNLNKGMRYSRKYVKSLKDYFEDFETAQVKSHSYFSRHADLLATISSEFLLFLHHQQKSQYILFQDLKRKTIFKTGLKQRQTNFHSEGPESKYFRLSSHMTCVEAIQIVTVGQKQLQTLYEVMVTLGSDRTLHTQVAQTIVADCSLKQILVKQLNSEFQANSLVGD